MEAEGVQFRCNAWVGKDIPATDLERDFDAILITTGSTKPRDLPIAGRELTGIHFAMEFLTQQNRRVSGKPVHVEEITAKGKRVVILGGGDTGSDCHGTSIRQGAKEIWSIELLPRPPEGYNEKTPWPLWPLILRSSSSHQEGGERDWSVLTKQFMGEHGQVKKLQCARLEWFEENGKMQMREIAGSEFELECDLVLLALGFVHPEHDVPTQLGLELDVRGNIKADYGAYGTSKANVFAAGDARRGQSLVVWAIHEGREAARAVDLYLMGYSDLPSAYSHGYDAAGAA
jgi:glutamate synthase (NADPH/NADH) small chain